MTPAWGEARRAGRAAADRVSAADGRSSTWVYKPRFKAAAHRCFYCGARWKLKTGRLAGVAVLWCPDCEGEYRRLQREL